MDKKLNKLLLYNNTETFILANFITLYVFESSHLKAMDGFNLCKVKYEMQKCIALIKQFRSNGEQWQSNTDMVFVMHITSLLNKYHEAIDYVIKVYEQDLDRLRTNDHFLNEMQNDLIGPPSYELTEEQRKDILELNLEFR